MQSFTPYINKQKIEAPLKHFRTMKVQVVALKPSGWGGTHLLCQHKFEHNGSLKALSIMPA